MDLDDHDLLRQDECENDTEWTNLVCDRVEDFKAEVQTGKDSSQQLNIFHVNLRSLRKNWELLQATLKKSEINWDMIFLSEIGIKNNETNLYKIKNFTPIWLTREKTKMGGGLAIFVNNRHVSNINHSFENFDENDVINVKLELNKENLFFIFAYRQPKTDLRKFIKGLREKLHALEKEENVIWLGDINIDILESNVKNTEKVKKTTYRTCKDQYENLLAKSGFEKKINSITREEIKQNKITKSCIDHLYIKTKKLKTKGIVINEKIADHYITCAVIVHEPTCVTHAKYEKSELKIRNEKNIIKELGKIDWSILDSYDNSDQMYDKITDIIKKVYLENTKIKTIANNQRNDDKACRPKKKWITSKNIEEINLKNKLWTKVKKYYNRHSTHNTEILQQYNALKNKIRRDLEVNKQNYYKEKIEKNKDMWGMINKLTKPKKISIDETIKKNFKNKTIWEIRNNFNRNFTDLTNRLKNKYRRKGKIKEKSRSEKNMRNENECVKATTQDFTKIIQNMKNSDSEGIDELCLKFFKHEPRNTAEMLMKLANCIMDTKVWPQNMKIQVVRPIYKKGKKNDLDNYRPISILPVINKMIEKFFVDQLQSFLDKWDIIIKEQFGFQKGKGTVEAIKEINEKISSALNNGKHVGAIFIDLQKAFDTINRKKLIEKLERNGLGKGFCGVLKSYLENRKSCIRLDNDYSDMTTTTYGVPQGSILGPILFLIYMNDINLKKKLNLILFADDIMSLEIENTFDELNSKLQRSLNLIQDWCQTNELYISEEKTKFIIFNNKLDIQPKLFLHKEKCNRKTCKSACNEIIRVKQIKYLGIEIDEKWSFQNHVEGICKKLRQIMPKLYFIKKFLNLENKKIVYDSWIKSYILYGIEVYGWAKQKELDRLQKVQNKLVKILFGNKFCNSATEIYKRTGILKAKQLQEYTIIKKKFYNVKTSRSIKIRDKIHNTKNTNLLPVLTNNKYGEKQQTYYIPKVFSRVPTKILQLEKIGVVKKEIMSWLLSDPKFV